MKIAKQISTNKWINDFQEDSTNEGLINNAAAAGYDINDVEVVDVTTSEYEAIKTEILAPIIAEKAEEDRIKREQLEQEVVSIKAQIGLSDAQFETLINYIKL